MRKLTRPELLIARAVDALRNLTQSRRIKTLEARVRRLEEQALELELGLDLAHAELNRAHAKEEGGFFTAQHIENLAEWWRLLTGNKFAQEIYKRAEADCYTQEKHGDVESRFLGWVCNLDSTKQGNLAASINAVDARYVRGSK